MHDVLDLAAKLRAALEQQNAAAITRLVDAYGAIYTRLEGDIDALLLKTGQDAPTQGQVQRLTQYMRLQERMAEEATGESDIGTRLLENFMTGRTDEQ